VTKEELERLSPEERARLAEAEREALRFLMRTVGDGARPQRHRWFALVVLVGIAAVFALCFVVVWLVARL
jgi:hypothetical protein